MGQEYIEGSRTMTDEELRELFADLKREIIEIKTELLLTRFAVEQTEQKVEKLEIQIELLKQPPPENPYGSNTKIEKF
jgi:ribosomal protein L29